jgi:hypothetical protein
MKNDKNKFIQDKNGLISKEVWESSFTKQIIKYQYDENNKLKNEIIIQINKENNEKLILFYQYVYKNNNILIRQVEINEKEQTVDTIEFIKNTFKQNAC